jgi:hypothetical protein
VRSPTARATNRVALEIEAEENGMKLILLAAAAVIAVPAVAQTTTDTQTQTDATTTPGTQDQSTTADQSMSTTTSATTPDQSMSTTGSADATAAEQAGGYQPATPPMSGTAEPGATVVFQPSVSPSQAFPPPPPLDHYPICKSGQTDGCMQRGGR